MRHIWLIILVVGPTIISGHAAKQPEIELPVQYYQIARLYGPGMEPSGKDFVSACKKKEGPK